MGEKTLVLYSGGKDSHYALVKALSQGYNVEKLLIAIPSRTDSWLFHTVNISWSALHGKLLGIDYDLMSCSGIRDVEVGELRRKLEELRRYGFKYVVSGVVASNYQKSVVDRLCSELGLTHITPLWGYDPYTLLFEELRTTEFVITALQAYGLDVKWLGSKIDLSNVEDFIAMCRKYNVNLVGEGGEFETFVTSSPLFQGRRICIKSSRKVWYPNYWTGYLIIEEAEIC
ncbi:MAG: diphthine--ammonia ligase [Sulfolobales archaeon]